jgi:hypothetical protein
MVTSWLRARGSRSAAGLVAAGIATAWLVAGLIYSVFVPTVLIVVLVAFVPPIVIVFLLGRRMADRAITSDRGIWATIGLGVLTVALNSYVVSWGLVAFLALAPPDPEIARPDIWSVLLGLLFMGALGILFVGWIAIVPALASAAVWTFLMRRLFPKGARAK